jgi:filamentous hemagglutinin family protein
VAHFERFSGVGSEAKSFPKQALLLGTAYLFVTAAAQAGGLPAHGHYVAGQGAINKANQSLTVKQSSTTGIIDWNKFSVGRNSSVVFDNGTGATLNRVTSGNLSKIAGSLHATGSLYLINSQGVIVSGTGRVTTGGNFVATGGSLSNDTFENDKLKLTNLKGNVINRGTIVSGGTAQLTGRVVRDSGRISASTVSLKAADSLTIDGAIDARNADGAGGTIVATAKHIAVGKSADVSASGTRGGTVLIGGDIHGGSIASDNFVSQTVTTAQTTQIAKGAHISADGASTTGGNVVIWSDGHTSFDGKISATGHTAGGFAEVSSHDLLGFTGKADLTSAAGKTGTLLLDPYDVVISTDANTSGPVPTSNTSIINTGVLEGALSAANVQVTTGSSGAQAGNISIIDPLTWSSSHTLELDAANSIVIGAPVKITGAGGLVLQYGDTFNTINGIGSVTFGNTDDLLFVNGTSYALENSIAGLASAIAATPNGHFALASNITAKEAAYKSDPIPTIFTGTLEGLGNSIKNLKITDSTDENVGLFGEIGSGGVVQDLDLTNPTVSGTLGSGSTVGALAGDNEGTVNFVDVVGGSVSGGSAAGVEIGGLLGLNNGSVSSSIVSDAVSGGSESEIGGLVGGSDAGAIARSSASGSVTAGILSDAGGLVGFNQAVVTTSYATGAVTMAGSGEVGGLVGSNGAIGEILASYATGAVSGGPASDVGGLVGINGGGEINSTYAMGSVTGGGDTSDVGGLIGENGVSGSIVASYSTGKVGSTSTGDNIGGFAGDNEGTVTGSYFDFDTPTSKHVGSGTTSAVGAGSATHIQGLTTVQMMNTANMPGLTFGTTAGGNGFVIFDLNESTNNVSSSVGATLPLLLGEATSAGDIHIITNAHQLQLVGLDPGGTYFLGGDISMSGTSTGKDVWTAANGFVPVTGTTPALDFFGVGQSIDNLYIDNPGPNAYFGVGLFGEIEGGRFENFALDDVKIISTGTDADVGALYGVSTAQPSTVIGVSSSGTVTSTNSFAGDVGGLIGDIDTGGGEFTGLSSSADVKITATGEVGGLVGQSNSEIDNSHATGSVTAGGGGSGLNTFAGGLVGDVFSFGAIESSFATGKITVGDEAAAGGLVGASDAAITSSYASGAVTAGNNAFAGGLIGLDQEGGTVQSYATGAVKAGTASDVGGFAGITYASLAGDFATGAVTSGASSDAGGFIGFNKNTGAAISQSYALGAVNGGGSANTGAFAGENGADATISQSYATGAVTGGSGFLGANDNTSATAIQSSYWDKQTTGKSTGLGSGTAQSGLTGLTTAQLQSGLPSGFDPANWSIVAGKSFPYLSWQVPSGTPEFISGTIKGGSSDIGVGVAILIDGKVLTPIVAMASGANGYYYELFAPGAIAAAGSDLLAYETSGSSKANFFVQNAPGSLTDLDLTANTLTVSSAAVSASSLISELETALGSDSGSDFLYTKAGTFTSGIDLDLDLGASSFSLNRSLNVGSGEVDIDAAGSISETSSSAIKAKTLTGKSHGKATFGSKSNVITDLGAFSTGSHAFALTDDHALTVDGKVNAGTGTLDLTTVGNNHDLAIEAAITGGTINLVTTGEATETSKGAITAKLLNVTADTGIDLTSKANKIKKLGTHKTKKGPDKVTL